MVELTLKRTAAIRTGVRLEALTVGWMAVEAVLAIGAGVAAGSVLLVACCAYLAAVTLAGVAVDGLTCWWWVEYVAAFGLLRWLLPEAREAIEAAREGRTYISCD